VRGTSNYEGGGIEARSVKHTEIILVWLSGNGRQLKTPIRCATSEPFEQESKLCAGASRLVATAVADCLSTARGERAPRSHCAAPSETSAVTVSAPKAAILKPRLRRCHHQHQPSLAQPGQRLSDRLEDQRRSRQNNNGSAISWAVEVSIYRFEFYRDLRSHRYWIATPMLICCETI